MPKKYEITRENIANHSTAPRANSARKVIFLSLIALSSGAYIHKIRSKKLHEIPGKIIAEIHTEAAKIIYHRAGSTVQELIIPIHHATIHHKTKKGISRSSCIFSLLKIIPILAMIRPKKNHRISSGVL